jgi:hypothetical protein
VRRVLRRVLWSSAEVSSGAVVKTVAPFMESEVHYYVLKSLNEMNPIHFFTPYSFELHFSVLLVYRPTFP